MKLIVLLSGGIDSPVAAQMMQQQGADIVLVHFHHQTMQQVGVKSKVMELVKTLASHAGKPIKLYMIPFKEIQQKLITVVPAEYRMIVYRRMMMLIADQILEKENADGFVTGDNLAQVASQTLENLQVVYSITNKKILTPLLGFDKIEIINHAKEIGTYETSILPYEDCCSFLVAKHPVTKAKQKDVDAVEIKIDKKELVENAINSATVTEVEAAVPQ